MNSRHPSESGMQMYARLTSKPSIRMQTELLASIDPKAGYIVEISGEAESGKTSLLMHAVCDIILDASANGSHQPQEVIWIDTDNRFSIFRFVEIVEARLDAVSEQSDGNDDDTREADVTKVLKRFHYIKALDSVELLHALDHLDEWIFQRRSVAALVIDSITAFYWLDRDSLDGSTGSVRAMHSKYADQLRRLASDHRILIMASRFVIRSSPGNDSSNMEPDDAATSGRKTKCRGLFDVMTSGWQRSVTIRICLRVLRIAGLIECSVEKHGQKSKPENVEITPAGIIRRL